MQLRDENLYSYSLKRCEYYLYNRFNSEERAVSKKDQILRREKRATKKSPNCNSVYYFLKNNVEWDKTSIIVRCNEIYSIYGDKDIFLHVQEENSLPMEYEHVKEILDYEIALLARSYCAEEEQLRYELIQQEIQSWDRLWDLFLIELEECPIFNSAEIIDYKGELKRQRREIREVEDKTSQMRLNEDKQLLKQLYALREQQGWTETKNENEDDAVLNRTLWRKWQREYEFTRAEEETCIEFIVAFADKLLQLEDQEELQRQNIFLEEMNTRMRLKDVQLDEQNIIADYRHIMLSF